MSKEIAKTKKYSPPHQNFFGVGARYKCLPVQILNGKICLGTACLPAEALAKEGGDETCPVRYFDVRAITQQYECK